MKNIAPEIGEIIQINNEWYQCIESFDCPKCDLKHLHNCNHHFHCSTLTRKDGKSVIFKKLEKIEKLYNVLIQGEWKCFQRYHTYTKPLYRGNLLTLTTGGYNFIDIENNQINKDMEEKKLTYEELLHYYHSTVGLWAIDKNPQEVSLDWICDNAFQLGVDEEDSNSENIGKNLKPFDLEAAKAGKPVCTRDGRKARIVCFDAKGIQPIIALITCGDKEKSVRYKNSGRFRFDGVPDEADLMMLPRKERDVGKHL